MLIWLGLLFECLLLHFPINHPNNLKSVKRKSSVNSHVCHRSLCSSSFMRTYLSFLFKLLHFIVASESLRHEQFCWGGIWASVQIKQCCNCWGNTWSLLMMTAENLCGRVQQHSSFHLCLAASSVVFYMHIDSQNVMKNHRKTLWWGVIFECPSLWKLFTSWHFIWQSFDFCSYFIR